MENKYVWRKFIWGHAVSFVSNIAKTRIIGPSSPVDIFLLLYTGKTPTAQPIIVAARFEALAVGARLLGLWVRVLPGAWMLVFMFQRQCTYHVILRCFHKIMFAVEEQLLLISVFTCASARGWVRVCVGEGRRKPACAYACLAILIQHVTRGHIVICGLSDVTVFYSIIS